jgi:hypothetical protein
MKSIMAVALLIFIGVGLGSVGHAANLDFSPASTLLLPADWQEPAVLPPQFRNHCSVDKFGGRPYCANHCGSDYQFFYCSQASFGCCHLGRGYCDWNGHLRCTP